VRRAVDDALGALVDEAVEDAMTTADTDTEGVS
jgi:hypothetical protein